MVVSQCADSFKFMFFDELLRKKINFCLTDPTQPHLTGPRNPRNRAKSYPTQLDPTHMALCPTLELS